MNDEPTSEVDFSGLHIVMLYAIEGINYWEEYGTDPYAIGYPDFLDGLDHAREVAKTLLLVLLNAKDSEAAYSAFRQKFEKGSPEKKFKNHQLELVHELLADKHPVIEKHFGADAGARLMNKDAQITEIIVRTFTERSIPVLLVHDSYIVPIGYEDFLIDTMANAFEEIMGVPLRGNETKAMKEGSPRQEELELPLMNWQPYEVVGQREAEKEYRDRLYPIRTPRYQKTWKAFRDWVTARDAEGERRWKYKFKEDYITKTFLEADRPNILGARPKPEPDDDW